MNNTRIGQKKKIKGELKEREIVKKKKNSIKFLKYKLQLINLITIIIKIYLKYGK